MQKLFTWFVGVAALLPLLAAADGVPVAHDLAADAQAARARGAAIVVFFASAGCPYCHTVEDLYLGPLASEDGRVLIRKVDIDSRARLVDFEGRVTDHGAFAAAHGASFTPLVRFHAADGRELVPSIAGFSAADFYGVLLDSAIRQALGRLASRACPSPASVC